MQRVTNITPLDEFYDDMTKEEIYQNYYYTWRELSQCLNQFEDLKFALETVKDTQETIKIQQVIEILDKMQKQRIELFNEHRASQTITIVCMEE